MKKNRQPELRGKDKSREKFTYFGRSRDHLNYVIRIGKKVFQIRQFNYDTQVEADIQAKLQ